MPLVAQQVPPDPDDRPIAVVRASDIEKTGSQVAVLCQIFESTSNFLAVPANADQRIEVDETAKAEALKTFELCNTRMRDIIDSDRWDLKMTPAEESSARTLEAQTKKIEAQTALLVTANAPHIQLNPQIRFFPGVGWVAWLGGGLPDMMKLHGRGNSPAQAFDAFDRNFRQIAVINAAAAATPPPPPVKPVRKRRNRKH